MDEKLNEYINEFTKKFLHENIKKKKYKYKN